MQCTVLWRVSIMRRIKNMGTEADQEFRLLELIHKSKDRDKAIEFFLKAIPGFLESLQTSPESIRACLPGLSETSL